ncbi:hypothetical protein [Paenibacillus oleatilyticus]|uniref:hypothetical protein n=1 Tax=Paenibacillus oleatilyticus TaxID=2594886 RepID=UPI001C1F4910|nr:hypothetical protein [Paenibacillus oleatilyticus]MBU7318645.1 hypothetical protein [Paenibacillus oleatilyticus]
MSQETIIETAEEFEHIHPYRYPWWHGHGPSGQPTQHFPPNPYWPSQGQHYHQYLGLTHPQSFNPHSFNLHGFNPFHRHHYPHHHHDMHGHHFYHHARWVQDPWTGEWYID